MKYSILFLCTIFQYYLSISQIINSDLENKSQIKENLNNLSAGYQIGGICYFGVEYEYRFSKYIGLNAGAGFSGFTAGFKFHSCPCRTGPFLNISFKDGGFGSIGSVDSEIGGVLIFFDRKEKIGLLGQIGAGKIIYLSNTMKDKLTKNSKNQTIIISFGIGISYYLK